MSIERQRKAEGIFREALSLDVSAREAWVRSTCGDDAALASDVLELLSFHDATLTPLDRTPVVAVLPRELAAGDRIGSYTIERKIGSGGMGAVYAAQQASPKRTVALKLMLPGLATPDLLRRFEYEAQLLGLLEHPGIARVYEAGAAPGPGGQTLPYFAMELVDGLMLAQHIGTSRVPRHAMLELFCQVCDAVEHAHKRGIIHRDLKPANIMVTRGERPVPKVLDFGIARLTSRSVEERVTIATQRSLAVVGTLAYMSPEQIAARNADDIDTRSDVYALGVMLFELLSGKLPHDVAGSSFYEAARMIREEPPRSLASLAPDVPADLRTIVIKSLEKDRGVRYQSAAELGADLRRFLANEPILARPPSLAYQARKFAQRHRALVAVGALGLMGLVGGLISTSIAYARAQEQRELAERNAAISRKEAAKATAVASFFSDMLKGVGPMVAAGRDTQLLRGILDSTSQQLPTRLKDDPEVQGLLRGTISCVYHDLGDTKTAYAMATQAVELLEKLVPSDSLELAEALNNLAVCTSNIMKPQDAMVLAERAKAIFVAADAKGVAGARRGAGLSELGMGDALRVQGKPADAVEHYLAASQLLDGAPDATPTDKAETARGLSNAYLDLSNGKEARRYAQQARDAFAVIYGEEAVSTAYADDLLGSACYMALDYQESVKAHRRAVQVARRILPPTHPILGQMISRLGMAVQTSGDLKQAETLHEEALTIIAASSEPDHQRIGYMYFNLSTLQTDLGQYDKSLASIAKAREIFVRIMGEDHPRVTACYGAASNALTLACRWKEAEVSVRDELARELKTKKPDDPSLSPARARMGQILAERAWEDFVAATDATQRAAAHAKALESLALVKEAAAARDATLPPDHWLRGNIHSLLGDAMVIAALSEPTPTKEGFDAASRELLDGNSVIEKGIAAVPPQYRERVSAFATLREARLAYARWTVWADVKARDELATLREETPQAYRHLIPADRAK
jgi:non-specific serine/threonine protein kinase/serine/threonine-protein kinase